MKALYDRRYDRRTFGILLVLALLGLVPNTAPAVGIGMTVGDGIAASCTEAALRNAVNAIASGSGTVSFNCGPEATINVTSPIVIASSLNVTLDGGDNKITIDGGGESRLFIVNQAAILQITRLTLMNGFASGNGGAIYHGGSNLYITNSTLANNHATGSGGAIWGSSTHLNNSTLTNNRADVNGGAVYIAAYNWFRLANATIAGNSAGTWGGGVFFEGYRASSIAWYDSILAGNTASQYGDCYNNGFYSNYSSSSYSLLGPSRCGIENNNANYIGNIAGVSDPRLAPLGDNGGVTPTMLPLPDSPAINAGNPAGGFFNTDQRGYGRSDRYDIGAAEYQGTPPPSVNAPPILSTIGNQFISEMELLQFTLSASDPNGNSLSYSASSLPAGATFDPATATFRWTPGFNQSGIYTVLFTVTDNGTPPMSDSEEITITVGNVNVPPKLSPIGNKTVNEEEMLTFTISATDPDGNTLTYSASNLPPGASFDPVNRTFTWIPTFDQAGNYSNLRFAVTDNGLPALSDSESIVVTVGNVNRPPHLNPIGNKSAREGQLLAFTVTASDPDGNSITYSAENMPAGATFNPASQTFSWTPAFDQTGNYKVMFLVMDEGIPNQADFEEVTITVGDVNRSPVLNPVGTRQTTEGETVSFYIQALDPDGDSITYSSGPLPAGAVFNPTTRLFSWTPGYGQAGSYTVTFYASDNGQPSMTAETSSVISVDQPSPAQLIDSAISVMQASSLPRMEKLLYSVELQVADKLIAKGLTRPAAVQLRTFIDRINNDIRHGRISPEDGNKLIGMATELLTIIGR